MSGTAWVEPFIGAPYSDDGKKPGTFNCWTLHCAALKAGFGITCADYEGPVWTGREGAQAMAQAAEAFAAQFDLIVTGAEWRGGNRIERPGDSILMRVSGVPVHVGLVIAPGHMLHTNKGIDACIERYGSTLWAKRIEAFYRIR